MSYFILSPNREFTQHMAGRQAAFSDLMNIKITIPSMHLDSSISFPNMFDAFSDKKYILIIFFMYNKGGREKT